MAETDLAFCERLLPEVSRTFAVSIQNLSTELRNAVCIAYLLCRIVDTVEDDPRLPPALRWSLFDAFDAALCRAARGSASLAFEDAAREADLGLGAESELCINSGAVFRVYAAQPANVRAIIQPRLLQMSRGMRGYTERAAAEGRLQIRDLPDLELYCYYVAGTVGELLSDLFLWACPVEPKRRAELIARAVRFGLALQLVNILKDVAEDSERGVCFLPQSHADAEGLELSRLFDPSQRERGLRVLRALARRAREHLAAAREYTLLWPLTPAGREVRLFCAGPLALALGTLREVEHGDDAFRKDRAPTVTRSFVARTLEQMWRAVAASDQADSDRLLSELFDRARVGVAGRPVRPVEPVGLVPYPATEQSSSRVPYPATEQSSSRVPYPATEQSSSRVPYPATEQSSSRVPYPATEQSSSRVPYPATEQSSSRVPYPATEQSSSPARDGEQPA